MAKLTTKARSKIGSQQFGLPSERKYPINDAAHAANAKARATQQYDAGNLSSGDKAKIDRKANAKLGE